MHQPTDPDPSELRAWLERGDRPRRLADWLFASARVNNQHSLLSQTQGLAFLPIEDVDLDLADPAQRAFGDYALLERLGQGGMGVVYRARQLSLDRDVALKLLAAGPWAGEDFIDRLRREARHVARLAHPHIVSVFDVGQHDAFFFYTMRLVEGESLRERLARDEALPEAEAVRIALNIAQALAYAHAVGVLHLDIKPANILLDGDSEPHLADFGLARHAESGPDDAGNGISGTPHYMAPEQADSSRGALSPATDVFALGATLFEMLSGRTPLPSGRPRDVLQDLLSGAVPRLREVTPHANRELDAICARCLARNPAQRYASATALADDLRRWQQHRPVQALHAHWVYRSRKFLRRNRMASALTGLIIAIVVMAIVAMAWQVQKTAHEASRTLQIKDQLIELFLQPEDAKLGKGDRTALEFLDQAATRLQELPPGSEVRGELAGVLVGIYSKFGEWQRAAALGEAELGGIPVTPERAAHSDLRLVAGWALAQWVSGRTEGVSVPLASAIAHSDDQYSQAYLDALVTQTRLAIAMGDFVKAVQSGEQALGLLQERSASAGDIVNARMELAAAYVGNRQALEGREQSEQGLVEARRGDSITHVHATTMAGLRRALFGDFAAAQVLFDDGAAQWRRLGLSADSLFEKNAYAVNAFDLGQIDRAGGIVDGVIAIIGAKPARERGASAAEALWLRGEIALHRGRYLNAAASFAASSANMHADEARFQPNALYCAALQVVALARAARLNEARRLLDATRHAAAKLPQPSVASSMLTASEASLLSAEHQHILAISTFDRALAELDAGRQRPAVLEDQLRENRDAVRLRVWKAQAQFDAGRSDEATATTKAARQLGLATLGPQHPFMHELTMLENQLATKR